MQTVCTRLSTSPTLEPGNEAMSNPIDEFSTCTCMYCSQYCLPENIKAAVDGHVSWHVLGVERVNDPQKRADGSIGYACRM